MHIAAPLLLCVVACAPAHADIDRAAFIRIASSVLKVEAVDTQGRFHLGSGVVVAPSVVVTNCHVTRRAARIAVVKGGVRWTSPGQSSDIGRDLCLLRVPGLADSAPVPVAESASLSIGQPVMAIGYTGGGGIQLSEGEVVALHRHDDARVVQTTNWFTSGASGGGLFSADGALVGILTFRLRGGAEHYFSAPVDWLRGRLAGDTVFARPEPLDGTAFWERPAQEQPYFLQAASLEQTRAWQPLRDLAERWTREAPREAEAAYVMAVADEALGRDTDALAALQRCLELDAGYVRGWQRMARLQRRLGRQAELRGTLERLRALDAGLARTLRNELDTR
jgi:serine protease Do